MLSSSVRRDAKASVRRRNVEIRLPPLEIAAACPQTAVLTGGLSLGGVNYRASQHIFASSARNSFGFLLTVLTPGCFPSEGRK